jgi:hypothetical protein
VGFSLETEMEDLEVTIDEDETSTPRSAQLQQVREYSQFILKRFIAFVCFGPGVLGFLWLMSRILRR